jgi:hypothetical protein
LLEADACVAAPCCHSCKIPNSKNPNQGERWYERHSLFSWRKEKKEKGRERRKKTRYKAGDDRNRGTCDHSPDRTRRRKTKKKKKKKKTGRRRPKLWLH